MIEVNEEDAINKMPWYSNDFYDDDLNERCWVSDQLYAQMMGWA